MNLIIMAGTSEGVEIIRRLSTLENIRIIATTTTTQGAKLAKLAGAEETISQALNTDELGKLIKNKGVTTLIDATHPFAADATKNAIKATELTKIKYIRLERPSAGLSSNKLIQKVYSFEEAVSKAEEFNKNVENRILQLAGVKNLYHLTERINTKQIFARVLPSVYSIKKCLTLGLPSENIIAMQGTFSKEFNKSLMIEYGINLMITKESGEAGGTPSKIEAAMELEIPVIMVMRPEVPELADKIVKHNIDDVYKLVSTNL